MFEAIGIGDLHLTNSVNKGGLSAYVADADAMVCRMVRRVLKYAKKHQVEHIIFYGDLCESPRMSYTAHLELLKILRLDFQFHLILGNHDVFSTTSDAGHSLELIQAAHLPNVSIYTTDTKVAFGKVSVKFLPYPSTAFDPTCLNVAHVDIAGSRSDSGRLTESDVKSKATCVIGHIHTMQQVRNSHYPGTLYQTNFGESAAKYFHHIRYDQDWEIENIPFTPEYRLHTVEASTVEDLQSVPTSKFDLIKLILLPESKLVAADYAHLNVVRTNAVANARDLDTVRLEDLVDGSEVEVNSSEFLKEWLRSSTAPSTLKKEAWLLRRSLL